MGPPLMCTCLDGHAVRQGGRRYRRAGRRAIAWAGKYEFELTDRALRRPAAISSQEPILPLKMRSCRLTVAGSVLYDE